MLKVAQLPLPTLTPRVVAVLAGETCPAVRPCAPISGSQPWTV